MTVTGHLRESGIDGTFVQWQAQPAGEMPHLFLFDLEAS